jgi:hypothetical protein
MKNLVKATAFAGAMLMGANAFAIEGSASSNDQVCVGIVIGFITIAYCKDV